MFSEGWLKGLNIKTECHWRKCKLIERAKLIIIKSRKLINFMEIKE